MVCVQGRRHDARSASWVGGFYRRAPKCTVLRGIAGELAVYMSAAHDLHVRGEVGTDLQWGLGPGLVRAPPVEQ